MTNRQPELIHFYTRLGVKAGQDVLITGNYGVFHELDIQDKDAWLGENLEALKQVVGPTGTIVVPTWTMSLCGTDKVFDKHSTPSESGMFSEFILKQPGVVRSDHPFMSYAAIGARAENICSNNSPHSYGPHTPEGRMIHENGIFLSIGVHPRLTCSTIHYTELTMGVPYRYTKEFEHPVLINGDVRKKNFYLFVWYRDCDFKRNHNKKIFAEFNEFQKEHFAGAKAYSYNMQDFVQATQKLFANDLYIWMDEEPTKKPFRN